MKQLIKNIQDWLLEDGRCTSCGSALAEGVKERYGNETYIVCSCLRLYVYDRQMKVFTKCDSECSLRQEELNNNGKITA